ncbi:hypothetical protein GcM3_053041 [Golovinomyces cichoracearum]|uniref:Uncharacterized protein n=1 Tax=Golovinomyces cichoracearum TaxID=62708 RepID=A0A420IYV2_9PEZI|nr:hypothetical protein GcM3_053041 [Golovinomyces cichoracearum]
MYHLPVTFLIRDAEVTPCRSHNFLKGQARGRSGRKIEVNFGANDIFSLRWAKSRFLVRQAVLGSPPYATTQPATLPGDNVGARAGSWEMPAERIGLPGRNRYAPVP